MNQESEKPAGGPEVQRLEDLMVRYWDGTLEPSELAELNELLAGRPELQAVFNDLSIQALVITESGATEDAVRAAAPARPTRSRTLRLLVGGAIAAALLVGVGLAVLHFYPIPGPVDEDGIAHLENITGLVTVSHNGAVRPVQGNQSLTPGQVVSTVGVNSSAEIRFPDGARVLLPGDSSVSRDRDGKISLHRGYLAAEVPPRLQEGPLYFTTPGSEVQARGTRLFMSSSNDQTRVARPQQTESAQGELQVKRLSDGQSVAVRPGEVAVAAADHELKPKTMPPTPDTLLVTFDEGLPDRWLAGQLVTDNLPEGSKGAVRAVGEVGGPRGIHHKVATQNAWTRGLFTIHDDSYLHIRFRVDKPGFFHVLVVAREQAPKRGCVVLEAPMFFQNRQPGQWHTVHLPFADFRPTEPGRVIDKPMIAFIICFDSQEVDRGLTIERYWVTRGPEMP
jgi:ferric-dicitrate binding protein FerR (iron transport regulator)